MFPNRGSSPRRQVHFQSFARKYDQMALLEIAHSGRRPAIPACRSQEHGTGKRQQQWECHVKAIEWLHRNKMYVVGGLIVGKP